MNEFFKLTNIPDDIANAKPIDPKKVLYRFKAEPEKKLDETKHQADVESKKPHVIFQDELNIYPKDILAKIMEQTNKYWEQLKSEDFELYLESIGLPPSMSDLTRIMSPRNVVTLGNTIKNLMKQEDKAAAEKTRMEEFKACKRVNESLEQGYEGFMNYIKRIRGTVDVCPTIKELADYLKLNGLPPEIADLARVSKTDYVIWLAQKVKGLMK